MSSFAERQELAGFFSYSREDDDAFKGTLSALRDGIQRELSAQLGRSKRTFRLWQDQEAIAPGKLWESEIKAAIDASVFFIPIVTPRAVSSKYCKFEFESFLAREKALGRRDLVFPILYISVPALESEAKWRDDLVLSTIGRRQYVDWRPLRHLDTHATTVREQIERLCQKIVEALNEPWISPEERRTIEEAKARHLAEEEARRLEAEAKRKAEEERRREQAEAKWLAEEEKRRNRAEAGPLLARICKALGAEALGWWRVRAAIGVAAIAVLLLIGWGGYASYRHTIERGVQRAVLKWEEDRKVDQAERERQAKATAEAEEKRKADEAEQQRKAKAEQERRAAAVQQTVPAAPRGISQSFESAGFIWLSNDQQLLLRKAAATVGISLGQIGEAEGIRKFPTQWPQIGKPGDLIFVADGGEQRFSRVMAAFVKQSRPSIRAFTLSAEGFEVLKSFSAFDIKFFDDNLFPRAKARFSAIPWSEHIKIANLPL